MLYCYRKASSVLLHGEVFAGVLGDAANANAINTPMLKIMPHAACRYHAAAVLTRSNGQVLLCTDGLNDRNAELAVLKKVIHTISAS